MESIQINEDWWRITFDNESPIYFGRGAMKELEKAFKESTYKPLIYYKEKINKKKFGSVKSSKYI